MKEVKTLYEFKHNFYSKLYAAMEKKNKTYKDLSNDLGKNPGYISRVMSGKIEPSFSMISLEERITHKVCKNTRQLNQCLKRMAVWKP